MLTPADIDSKQFSTTRIKEGYVQEEVDDFLDRVQEDYAFATQQLARLEEENRTLRRKLEAASSAPTEQLAPVVAAPSAVAEKLLAAAQKAHDEHVADGKAEADRVVREAGAEGARLVEEAQRAAEKIKSEGLAERYRHIEDLDRKQAELDSAVERLIDRGATIRRSLQTALGEIGDKF